MKRVIKSRKVGRASPRAAKKKTAASASSSGSARSSFTPPPRPLTSLSHLAILSNELSARKEADPSFSMRDFASRLNLDSGTMSRILRGERALSLKTALKILDVLNFGEDERRAFMQGVEHQALALTRGERTPEQRLRPMKALEKKINGMSPEELQHHERMREARAKIDRVVELDCLGQTLFLTTAVEGAKVHRKFLAAIETYLAYKKARLLIMTCKAHLQPLNEVEYPLDDIILEKYSDCVNRRMSLNKILSALSMDKRPYVSDPLSGGLKELGAANGRSLIIAHPQQRLTTHPNGMSRFGGPRVHTTTGALTEPLYKDNDSGLLADERHVIGGVIVEVLEERYHIRHVQADVDGSFVDLGLRFNPDGTIEEEVTEVLIRGDDHVGFCDPKANAALDEVSDLMLPRRTVIHDLMDAASVSHHRENSIKAQLVIPEEVETLEKELLACRRFLERLSKRKPKGSEIIVVASNHNEHLHQYLNSKKRWINDRQNYKKALELAYHYHIRDIDPLVYGIDPEQKLATWLTRNTETVRVCGVAINNHGDKGPNGSRGSAKGDAVSYGKSSSGHSHSPEMWRGATRVGTSSILDMDYTAGSPSSWAHAFELIYRGRGPIGMRQLIIIVDGHWRMEKSEAKAALSQGAAVRKASVGRAASASGRAAARSRPASKVASKVASKSAKSTPRTRSTTVSSGDKKKSGSRVSKLRIPPRRPTSASRTRKSA